jgi:hypothetical protein
MCQGAGRYQDAVLLSAVGIAQMMQPGSRQAEGPLAGDGMGWFTGPRGGPVLAATAGTRRTLTPAWWRRQPADVGVCGPV